MKQSEFRRAMAEEFGEAYATVLLRDHWLAEFSATPNEALSEGATPRDVWLSLCADLQVPQERWHGRGLRDPRD